MKRVEGLFVGNEEVERIIVKEESKTEKQAKEALEGSPFEIGGAGGCAICRPRAR